MRFISYTAYPIDQNSLLVITQKRHDGWSSTGLCVRFKLKKHRIDGILKQNVGETVTAIYFADYLAILVTDKIAKNLVRKTNKALK